MSDDSHRALKRWERAKQMAAVRSDPDLTGPLADCLIRTLKSGVEHAAGAALESIPVFIVAMFTQDLTCVKACREPLPEGHPGAYWLVRGAIQWQTYMRAIVNHYRAGLPVPGPFQPVRKIGSEIVSHLHALPDKVLPSVFDRLRESGLLPVLPGLTRETCPLSLPWDNIRACFQDFPGEK